MSPVSIARIRLELRALAAATWKARPELLVAGALLAGWLLITIGAAHLTAPIAWAFSIGLLLLSLCGWRFLWRLFRDGLYELTREEPRGS